MISPYVQLLKPGLNQRMMSRWVNWSQMDTNVIPFTGKKGGGIAVIHNKSLKAKVLDAGNFASYQYMELLIPKGSDSVKLVVIYRPPSCPYNSKTNPVPESTFFQEFTEHMETVLISASTLCVMGDFNFHMDLLDIDSNQLSDAEKRSKQLATTFHDILYYY